VSVSGHKHRGQVPDPGSPQDRRLLPGHGWGRRRRPTDREAPAEAATASVTCLKPPSRYAPGADGPCGPGAAPDGVTPADISALSLESVGHSSLVTEDHREVSPVSRGVLSQPLSGPLQAGLRLLPDPLPAAPCGRLTAAVPGRRTSSREGNGLTTFRRRNPREGVGGVSPPVARHLRGRSSEPPNLATYHFGPSLSAPWACLK
jgi:hypothetical protein